MRSAKKPRPISQRAARELQLMLDERENRLVTIDQACNRLRSDHEALKIDAQSLRKTIERLEKAKVDESRRADNAAKRCDELRGVIARLEIDLARAQGYIDRIVEHERKPVITPVEQPDTTMRGPLIQTHSTLDPYYRSPNDGNLQWWR